MPAGEEEVIKQPCQRSGGGDGRKEIKGAAEERQGRLLSGMEKYRQCWEILPTTRALAFFDIRYNVVELFLCMRKNKTEVATNS